MRVDSWVMRDQVARYSHSSRDHNRLLLLALVEEWGSKCYWCRTPKTFREMQIDHIVARNPRVGEAPGFDVDAAENLAPICGPCNQEKSNNSYQDDPRVASQIKAAESHAPSVQRNLTSFHRDTTVVRALLAVTAADLENEDVSAAISSFVAAILPVVRDRFPEILDAPYAKDYTQYQSAIEFKGHVFQPQDDASIIELDAQSRRALVVLEDVFGITINQTFDQVRGHISRRADEYAEEWLRGSSSPYAEAWLSSRPSSNAIGIFMHELRYLDEEVEIAGEIDGSFAADIEEYDSDPERWTTSRGVSFDILGEFTARFAADGLMDIYVHVGEPRENEWRHQPHSMELDD